MKYSELIKVIICNVILYIICFLILPNVFTNFYPRSNEATCLFFAMHIVITFLFMMFCSMKMRYYLISDVIYLILMFIYSGGAYGIGISKIDLDGLYSSVSKSGDLFGSAVTILIVLVIQFAIRGLVFILKKITCKKNKGEMING